MVKYVCNSCKTECDDITEHMLKVHKFSKWIMEIQLKTNPNTYKNCFEKKAQNYNIKFCNLILSFYSYIKLFVLDFNSFKKSCKHG